MQSSSPTRLIICVDGAKRPEDSQTNVHRVFAGVRRGDYWNGQTTIRQVPQYFPGVGSVDETISAGGISVGVLSKSYLKQIQDVYESCCQLSGADDQVWFFGFGRGAYTVRAVAGLMHSHGCLNSAGSENFSNDFKNMLKENRTSLSSLRDLTRSVSKSSLSPSTHSSISNVSTRSAPRTEFLGVFDTASAGVDERALNVSNIDFIAHVRHCVALHEDRKTFAPELILINNDEAKKFNEQRRTFLQACFIGTHADMGGLDRKGGLALYPLQWMIDEAVSCGLGLDPNGGFTERGERPPLSVLSPIPEKKTKKKPTAWSCQTENGIVIKMHDIRASHDIIDPRQNYKVKLRTSRPGSVRIRKTREIFDNTGYLRGYCSNYPAGSIIHPSVYMILDEHINVAMDNKELKLQRDLEDWRPTMLGSKHGMINTGFWLNGDEDEDAVDVGAIRVLVCGNTGVGKSTLINKIFGVDVTESSDRMRGIHDVRQEIRFEGRPDLIVHDSGGFEAGAETELQAIEFFLKDKSTAEEILDRLHVIWFCVDINSPRTLQTATEKLFKAVSEYAVDVPIIVVATKKDDLLDIEFGAHRKLLKREGKGFDEEACEAFAEGKLSERIEIIRSEMESVPGGRLDACLAVSQDDDDSIAHLSKTTSQCFDTDKVRLLYIRAQVNRIDLKIDMALCEVAKRYKRLIHSATGSTFVPMGNLINKKANLATMTKAIINCFGLPLVSADATLEALRTNLWSHIGTNVGLAITDSIQTVMVTGSAFSMGAPIWLLSGGIALAYTVPATARLFLIMACDLVFVLARSFREVTFRTTGQPNERDVQAAARNYRVRGYSQYVHGDVKKLVPRRNLAASFRSDHVMRGVESIIARYKDKLVEDVDLPVKGREKSRSQGEEQDDVDEDADSTLFDDIREAHDKAAELEGQSNPVEFDAKQTVAELPGDNSIVELDANESSRFDYPGGAAELGETSIHQERAELDSHEVRFQYYNGQ